MKSGKTVASKGNRSSPVSPMKTPLRRQQQQPWWKAAGAGTKAWLVVSESGDSHLEEVGKHWIMRRTGLPARDLRILDPMFSHPSTVLGRERAIVVNLEHIKAIVTATEVLVLSSKNPQVTAFVEDLLYHVCNYHTIPPQAAEGSNIEMGVKRKNPCSSPSILSHDELESPMPRRAISVARPTIFLETENRCPDSTFDAPKGSGNKVLPFEFIALEVCLQCACRCLESEASLLEKEAYPALDELTSKLSTLNLERVRQIKNRLVAISGRVQKVRDELENLLDEDMDMAGMYLTDKLVRRQSENTSSMAEVDDDALGIEDERQVSSSLLLHGFKGLFSIIDDDSKSQVKSGYNSLGGSKPNIEELEMLLEAYFKQLEGTLSKLSTLREYVDDTEDYINIMLDDKQNQMLQLGVVIGTATLIVTTGIVVTGVMGMNIRTDLFNFGTQSQFLETTLGTAAGCIILYIMAIGFGKKTGLLA